MERDLVVDFVMSNFLFGDGARLPDDQTSLIESGIVDSTGILELIEFIESTFGFEVRDPETVPENLDSIAGIVSFILRKSAVAV